MPRLKDSHMLAAQNSLGMPESDSKVHAIAMVRNDADVIRPFLARADELFDMLFLVDVHKPKGANEIVTAFAEGSAKIRVYSVERPEKYQSAIMNRLARAAFEE